MKSILQCISLLAEDGSPIQARALLRLLREWFSKNGFPAEYALIKAPGFKTNKSRIEDVESRFDDERIEKADRFGFSRLYPGEYDFLEPAALASAKLKDRHIVICVDQALWKGSTEQYCELANAIFVHFPFVYGYCYLLPKDLGPYFYATGISFKTKSEFTEADREGDLRAAWNNNVLLTLGEDVRRDKIRQVYRLQFLSSTHLQLPIEGRTLEKWIKKSADNGNLSKLASGIWSWELPHVGAVNRANLALHAAGLLTAWEPALAGPIYW